MFDINQIYKIDDFLTDNERNSFDILCEKYKWNLSGFSYNPKTRIFWTKDLWESISDPCVEIEQTFRTKIEDIFNIKLETVRIYLNGQAHGQCGSMHSDITEDDNGEEYITLIYYVNKKWSPEMGGFTVIIDHKKDMHTCYPNSIVIFNSRLQHVGLEPTTHCITQRVTMAHKFKVIK
jgi:Rps23 Pro-64 3,4-dihydroxylase Tpa1-like proline 4-hydroxylase